MSQEEQEAQTHRAVTEYAETRKALVRLDGKSKDLSRHLRAAADCLMDERCLDGRAIEIANALPDRAGLMRHIVETQSARNRLRELRAYLEGLGLDLK